MKLKLVYSDLHCSDTMFCYGFRGRRNHLLCCFLLSDIQSLAAEKSIERNPVQAMLPTQDAQNTLTSHITPATLGPTKTSFGLRSGCYKKIFSKEMNDN